MRCGPAGAGPALADLSDRFLPPTPASGGRVVFGTVLEACDA
jgi:hypothetical protein